VQQSILAYIRKHALLKAGDRVGVAVSGGADSVSLLLTMLDLRAELGILLSVVHFNHLIRGDASDADQQFVADLAKIHKLDLHSSSANAPRFAEQTKESLETAARELRYNYFRELLEKGIVSKVATAHTMNDQAETVLMRFLRGAGTKGLAGIYPEKSEASGGIIRPLLQTTRADVEAFLQSRGQPWREDSTNADRSHTRNQLRHDLLPLIAKDYNPAIAETLSRSAEVARAEEEYWQTETARLLPLVVLHGKPVRGGGRQSTTHTEHRISALSIEALSRQPLALQRRLIRAAAETLGIPLDSAHVEQILDVAASGTACELPDGWRAQRSFRELRFERSEKPTADGKAHYECPLPIPGQVPIPNGNLVVHAHLLPGLAEIEGYNHRTLPERHSGNGTANSGQGQKSPSGGGLELFSGEQSAGPLESLGKFSGSLTLRSWRPGDRFRPAHSKAEKKIKELLQDMKIPAAERAGWPVIAAGQKIIWVRGTRPLKLWVADTTAGGHLQSLVIEAIEIARQTSLKQGGTSE
jgi:tRNA(Ile)-lysidine synthase